MSDNAQLQICYNIHNYARLCAPNYIDQVWELLKNKDFCTFPASPYKHHCYEGGLLQHTNEVIGLALNLCDYNKYLNKESIFLGALLHDVGKIKVYNKDIDTYIYNLEYSKTLHISESLKYYKENFTNTPLLNNVIHIIKSHHGPIEHGSLEEPETHEAWAVHLADMQSAFCLGGRKNV
jgi:3'-5' exoribonuclease